MQINIKDFLSIKNVNFKIKKGITIIAGKNGSGKSQLLLGIAHNNYPYLLQQYGYGDQYHGSTIRGVSTQPIPQLVLYRPAIRKLAENNRSNEYAYAQPLSNIFDPVSKTGYSCNIDNRFQQIYTIVANLFISGNLKNATKQQQNDWNLITSNFKKVFNKEFCGMSDTSKGIKIGVKLQDGSITSLNSLSTGELEFISLLCDLILEYEIPFRTENNESGKVESLNTKTAKADIILIDELDAHFHPDLQKEILKVIKSLCADKYVIITTHSPSLMLSIDSESLFFLDRANESFVEVDNTYKNQISSLSDDSSLYIKMAEMYKGFTTDLNLARHFSISNNNELLRYTEECMKASISLPPEKGKETDPQISALYNFILTIQNPTIMEVGCGKGRTLSMFNVFNEEILKTISYFGIDIDDNNLEEIDNYARKIGLKDKLGSFRIEKSAQGINADLCIFANVIHEINPPELATVLNNYMKSVKPNGIISILEVLQLVNGEENYVIFYPEALKEIFKKECESGNIHINIATPHTYSGLPLMTMNLIIKDPNNVNITNEDISRGLDEVIKIESKNLIQRYNGDQAMKSLQLAFKTHNLSNASMFKYLIRS